MKKTVLSALFVIAFLLAACGPQPTPTAVEVMPTATLMAVPPASPTSPSSGTTLSGSADVSIAGFAFSPQTLTVKVGTIVTWTNNDSATHSIAADDSSFASADLAQGDTYTHTFTTEGTFAYSCGIHSSMHGTITVVQ